MLYSMHACFAVPGRVVIGLAVTAAALPATDLTIRLPDAPSISRQTVDYSCDANGAKIGLPAKPFPAEYINGGGNSLVVVPIAGNLLIFSNVTSGSGARFTAQQYTWWEAQGRVTLSSDSLSGKLASSCHQLPAK